ncbi:uncharacterized protein LOC116250109 [Nymphaea colorata]|uniref:uncharacterized protein LOC116250109 n=1 Tax=Nymphaea colorata TaxID=210225 RepID=UPI00129D2FF2|nr:uncharacterized protein LOC116250109 [Nymphaea colorata]XP_031479367.1 uncharacterized protein LOC116250109 [Nymphaea colorata]XP_049933086.1 uncharacterized protein LOC116250109 [Nymphaea colorata]XP_049933087.1 uncharacterized protein LOC116250109 [Nymphaea colorata]XP_049933088.1 uncharacterized protein LOC116250109 [Nymphaea colorata]
MSSILMFSSLSNTFCSHPKALHLARCSSTSKDHRVSFKSLLKNPLLRHVNASRRISQARHLHHCPLPRAGGSSDGNAELLSDSEQPSVDGNEPTRPAAEGATLDLKLPRRSLLVQFTCNACGDRTRRFVNRVAYERGTIFLQCAGCQQYHKFVDNLGLVVEYDFRKEEDIDIDKIDVQHF